MISYDETTGLVALECDSPGCNKTHSLVSTVGDQGRSAMNSLLVTMMQDGWYTEINGKEDRIKHFCPRCGVNMEGVQQLASRRQPWSSSVAGIVSAQALRSMSSDEAKKVRSARRKDQERGTPGLSDLDGDSIENLRSMMAKGRKVFGDG